MTVVVIAASIVGFVTGVIALIMSHRTNRRFDNYTRTATGVVDEANAFDRDLRRSNYCSRAMGV